VGHVQNIFTLRNLRQAKAAIRCRQLIKRVIEHVNPGSHRAMKGALDPVRQTDAARLLKGFHLLSPG
jgi:hypothetical protein